MTKIVAHLARLPLLGLSGFLSVVLLITILTMQLCEPRVSAEPEKTNPNPARVIVLPATAQIGLSETITVSIAIQDVDNLFGAEMHLAFDAERLQVVDPLTGQPANQVSPGAIFHSKPAITYQNQVNNTLGQVDYAIGLYGAQTEPFTGTATLAIVTFRGISAGVSPVAFVGAPAAPTGVLLSDSLAH